MMKKMLVLALVLAVAGLANAAYDLSTVSGLSYSISGNTLTLKSTTLAVSGFNFALKTDNGTDLSNAIVDATKFPGVHTTGFMTGGQYDGISAGIGATGTATLDGTVFSIDFAQGVKKIYFVFSNETFDVSDINLGGNRVVLSSDAEGINQDSTAQAFMTIPEPMTMVLLGLGGLFLRKK